MLDLYKALLYRAALMDSMKRACSAVGGQSVLAGLLKVTDSAVSQWVKGIRPVPPGRAVAIEQATKGAVSRRELRPDDWHLWWPDESTGESASPPQPLAEPA